MWRVMATAPKDGSEVLAYGWMGGTFLYRYRVTHWADEAWCGWGIHTPSYWTRLPVTPDVSLATF